LLSLFHNLDQAPALGFAQRTCHLDQNLIAFFRFVLFVVGFVNRSLLLIFAVLLVANATEDLDRDGLIHLIADHFANHFLAADACALFGAILTVG
jgi:hypothetical protein